MIEEYTHLKILLLILQFLIEGTINSYPKIVKIVEKNDEKIIFRIY